MLTLLGEIMVLGGFYLCFCGGTDHDLIIGAVAIVLGVVLMVVGKVVMKEDNE